MIQIELLPARHGNAIWIEYGTEKQKHRILIDGGPAHAYQTGLRRRIEKQADTERHFELMVVTHIDADHIDGALILMQELEMLNVSSIAFVLEYDNVAILCAADARPPILAASLERLAAERFRPVLHFDAVKLAHHGSVGNISADLLKWIDSPRWLISTYGDKFQHPDIEALRLIVASSKNQTE